MSIELLDYTNSDYDLTSTQTVLTDIPDSSHARLCQARIALGDGVKNLDGSGGNFELTIVVGGQTWNGGPQIVTLGTDVRAIIWTEQFPVHVGDQVDLKVKSPNAADTDVDVVARLYDVASVRLHDGPHGGSSMRITFEHIEGVGTTEGEACVSITGKSGAADTDGEHAVHMIGGDGGNSGGADNAGSGGAGLKCDGGGGGDGSVGFDAGDGGNGIEADGGNAGATNGGNDAGGGHGASVAGGEATDGDGGEGLRAAGGDSSAGDGGTGLRADGGEATGGTGAGGEGAKFEGGDSAGGTGGVGLVAQGSESNGGDAVVFEAQSGDADAFQLIGSGTGAAINADAGATGTCVDLDATSGSCIDATTAAGTAFKLSGTTHGFEIAASAGIGVEIDGTVRAIDAQASAGVAVNFQGTTGAFQLSASNGRVIFVQSTGGNGDAIYLAANGTGEAINAAVGDIAANIVGNITGNLSGSVGSVTGNVGGNVTGSVGSLATQAKADVNAECDTALSDWGKTGFSLAADQSGVTIGTVTTLTGHTAQTGDSFARLGAPAGASIAADIAAIDSAALTQQNVRDAMKLAPTAGSPATGSVDAHLDDLSTAAITVTVSAGEVSSSELTAYQFAGFSYVFTVTDDDGNAIDLSGKSLAFVAFEPGDSTDVKWTLTSGGGEIGVSGANNNIVTVSGTDACTQTAGRVGFILRNTTDDTALAVGNLTVEVAGDVS